jgi:cardiolipin synthase A/B
MKTMFTVHHKVRDIWEAQLKDIEEAKESVLLEQYIIENFEEGGIGRRFLDVLVQKAREGVEVRCILDAQGCFDLFKSQSLNDPLIEAGAEIFYYKTLGVSKLISPARLFLRDHRKLLVVDGKITWIGGAVVGERFRDWNDLMVRFTDERTAAIADAEFRNQLLRLQDKTSILAPMQRVDNRNHLSGNAPGIGNRFCYEEICHAIMLAQKSVVMVTPYFAPPLKLERVLCRRLSDGLPITLLVTRKTDHWMADISREGYFKKFLRKGLVLKYTDDMIHAKAVIVDDTWMTFGSTNLDALSLIFNHELNMVTHDVELITEVSALIRTWSEGLEAATIKTCEYRNYPWYARVLGRFLRYVA